MTSDSAESDVRPEWPSQREQIVYREGVRVLKAQKEDIDDLDDKALRTVRITAILLVAGVTAIEIGEIDPNSNVLFISILPFLFSSVFGIIVYNESDELIGPKASYLTKIANDDIEHGWRSDFLHQLPGWISKNQRVVELNGYLLGICQVFFAIGVGTGILALAGLNTGHIIGLLSLISVFTVVILFFFGTAVADESKPNVD
ncbi:hypothetical protein J2751_002502 [Halorubrum alkaliphilum]|uniref:Uncharacterized protein n=1 Tax=Halorubrum alkaliphilum TaxID=261290 RepID=A0A8T4GIN4_9EURY|nr:hypothetical protein [Halorubrum alkaliphilum]MBP1923460.1 hypothetical protein [Halorubrum alkaliphilum]